MADSGVMDAVKRTPGTDTYFGTFVNVRNLKEPEV